MPNRTIEVEGTQWNVFPSGYPTQYDADEFGLLFVRGTGGGRAVRVTRYSPQGSRSREQSLAEMSDAALHGISRLRTKSAATCRRLA